MIHLPDRLTRFLRLLSQIALLIGIWLMAQALSDHWLPALPPTVSGIAIALVLLALGVLKREWVTEGSAWLLREMLLFFIPVVIAVLQYQDLVTGHILAITFVITASTACVMVSTALAVDLAWRIESKWHKPKPHKDAL